MIYNITIHFQEDAAGGGRREVIHLVAIHRAPPPPPPKGVAFKFLYIKGWRKEDKTRKGWKSNPSGRNACKNRRNFWQKLQRKDADSVNSPTAGAELFTLVIPFCLTLGF